MFMMPLGMPAFQIRVPGFESWLPDNADPGRQQVMIQVTGSLPPTRDTCIEFLAPGCRHLAGKYTSGWELYMNTFKIFLSKINFSFLICTMGVMVIVSNVLN